MSVQSGFEAASEKFALRNVVLLEAESRPAKRERAGANETVC